MNAYAAATLAVKAISFARRRRRMVFSGENTIIDCDDDGGEGGIGGEEAS